MSIKFNQFSEIRLPGIKISPSVYYELVGLATRRMKFFKVKNGLSSGKNKVELNFCGLDALHDILVEHPSYSFAEIRSKLNYRLIEIYREDLNFRQPGYKELALKKVNWERYYDLDYKEARKIKMRNKYKTDPVYKKATNKRVYNWHKEKMNTDPEYKSAYNKKKNEARKRRYETDAEYREKVKARRRGSIKRPEAS